MTWEDGDTLVTVIAATIAAAEKQYGKGTGEAQALQLLCSKQIMPLINEPDVKKAINITLDDITQDVSDVASENINRMAGIITIIQKWNIIFMKKILQVEEYNKRLLNQYATYDMTRNCPTFTKDPGFSQTVTGSAKNPATRERLRYDVICMKTMEHQVKLAKWLMKNGPAIREYEKNNGHGICCDLSTDIVSPSSSTPSPSPSPTPSSPTPSPSSSSPSSPTPSQSNNNNTQDKTKLILIVVCAVIGVLILCLLIAAIIKKSRQQQVVYYYVPPQ